MNCAQVSYQSALNWQNDWIKSAATKPQAVEVFCFESKPVVTLGLRGSYERDVAEECEIEILEVDRGGEATYHGPGQLVIFPSLHLPSFQLSVRDWVGLLLKVTEDLLRKYEIPAKWNEAKPGVFTPIGKIAAIGLKIEGGFSRHGLALNVNSDLEPFANIRSCGVARAKIDQMSHWPEAETNLEILSGEWKKIFFERLHLRMASKAATQSPTF